MTAELIFINYNLVLKYGLINENLRTMHRPIIYILWSMEQTVQCHNN